MKVLRILLALLIPIVFLVLGFKAGLWTSSSAVTVQSASHPSENQADLQNSSLISPQFNLLLLSVGSTKAGNLLSAWMVSYHHSSPNIINFVPLYPMPDKGMEQLNQMVRDHFEISTTGDLSPTFIETLQSMYMVKWDGYLVLDSTELSQAVDILGGLTTKDSSLSGTQFVSQTSQIQGASSLEKRAEAIKLLCSQITSMPDSEQVGTFGDYLTARLRVINENTHLSPTSLKSAITNPQLICVFPTLNTQ